MSAADYIDLLGARKSLIARTDARIAPYDALVMPTTANTPPRIADLADDKAFTTQNLRALRNCTLINMIDGCAISLPAHREGEVPVGLMLAGCGRSGPPHLRTRGRNGGRHPCLILPSPSRTRARPTPLTLAIDQAVIAGWTGRDPVARDKHIAELEAIGIARPASTPIYYRVSARRLTTADSIEVCGGDSSGEVEFVLIGWQGRIFVGSAPTTPTARSRPTASRSPSRCATSRSRPMLWELEDVIGHWDRMILRAWAWIDGARVLYQEGTLDACCRSRT